MIQQEDRYHYPIAQYPSSSEGENYSIYNTTPLDVDYLSLQDDIKPERVDDLIEDILNRYSQTKTNNRTNNSSVLEVKSANSSISHMMMADTTMNSEMTDIERLAQYIMLDRSTTNDKTIRDHSFSSIDSTSFLKKQKLTVPVGFNFRTEKRSQNQKLDYTMELEDKELSECTFKPSINPNSTQMIQTSTNFFDRAMEWKRKMQMEREKLEKEKDEQVKKQHTFQPNVNPNVTDVSIRSDIHEKLYVNSMVQQSRKELHRSKMVSEEMKDCTFKPKLTARSVTPVQSRYMSRNYGKKKIAEDKIGVRSDESECTFAPQIKPNHQYHSSGSQFYLQSNAFDRLSRPRSPTDKENMNYSVLSSSSYSSCSSRRPKSASARLDFQSFLERQNNTLKRKQEKVELLKTSMGAQPKSFVNPRSEGLLRTSNQQSIDFHTRQDHHIVRKQFHQKQQLASQEKECTFKPSINVSSKIMPKRSYEQMSHGDYEAYKKKVSELKDSIAKKEAAQYTYNPQTNRNGRIRGALRVLDDPDAYMERVKAQQMATERRALSELKLREQLELQQCTFKPETHDAPEYVKRIAESMALTRLNHSSIQAKQKPDWR